MTNKNKIHYDDLISYGLVLIVPLSVYPITSNGITLGDALAIFLLAISLLRIKKHNYKQKVAMPLMMYLFAIVAISLLQFQFGIKDIRAGIMSFARYVLYLLVIVIISKNGVNLNKTYSLYKKIAIAIAIYTILQFITYHTVGKILPVNILGLKTFDRVYISDSISNYATAGKFYRPSGIFIEPAHYAAFQAPILYMLFNNILKKNKHDKFYSYLIIVSLLLTGSTLGIVVIIYSTIKPIIITAKRNLLRTTAVLISLIAILGLFLSTDYGALIYQRTFSDSSNGAINGRFGNIEEIQNNSHKIIGNGLKATENYLPSYPYLYLSYGFLGIIIFVIVVLVTYSNCTKIGKETLLLFLFVCIGTASLFGNTVILYLTIIYANYNTNKNINTAQIKLLETEK